MSDAQPRVSVVTPFYNTSAYLAECIESVLKQTLTDFEYLLVNNQSTDGSDAIAERYAARDSRIRVVKTPRFFSQVENYNFALEQIAPGTRFCKVVQADDWIFQNCLAEMVAAGEAHPSAAIVSSYELNDRRVTGTGLAPNRELISGREACRLFLVGGVYMFGSPTTLLYSSDVVRSRRPFFELGRLHEDTEVVFELLRDHDFAFVHQVLTFTRVHSDSISGAARDFAPDALDRLILVKRFGPEFLDAGEFHACLRQAERLYYGSLVRQWLTQPRREFWEYHKQGLANAGERLRPHLIARHAGALALESLLPPLVLRGVKKALAT